MKIAFQNFLTTLKRYKTVSILNIAGLTLAFIAFYILMAQVHFEFTYNQSIPDNERIYLVANTSDKDSPLQEWAPRKSTTETMQECSDVELWGFTDLYNLPEMCRVWSKKDGVETAYNYSAVQMSPSMLDIVSIKMIHGTKEDFKRNHCVFISASAAKAMDVKLGDDIYLPHRDRSGKVRPGDAYMISGIFKDFAENTTFGNANVIKALDDKYMMADGYRVLQGFVKLYSNTTSEKFEQMWEAKVNAPIQHTLPDGRQVTIRDSSHAVAKLISLREQYFATPLERAQAIKQGDKFNTITQFTIAVLIIVMAFINFVNFFMVMIPRRLRVVNISKVFGAANFTLRWSFLFEALAITFISLALALYLMIAIKDTFIADYVSCSLALKDNLPTIGLILISGAAMAIMAALYPAWYITSFNPSLAVKGGFAGSVSGRRLRVVLIAVQFTISMTLIICTFAFFIQYRHLTKYDIGFKTDNIMQVDIRDWSFRGKRHSESFISELESSANVVDVTAANGGFFTSGIISRITIDDQTNVQVEHRSVRHNFFKFFNMPVNLGRDFTPEDSGNKNAHIYNSITYDLEQKSAEYYKKANTSSFTRVQMIGVLDEKMLITPLNEDQKPIKYYCAAPDELSTFYIRLHPTVDVAQFSEFVRQKIQEFGVDVEMYDISMFEDTFTEQYSHTHKQTILLALFSMLSIAISLMGVFGIVIFETQFRRKEIAIRRVFGATTSGLLWMFNSRYALIVIGCFMMATPIAYYIIQEWQKDFAHKAPIAWWVYVGAFALVMLITASLVTYRSYKAAGENPAQVVKGE